MTRRRFRRLLSRLDHAALDLVTQLAFVTLERSMMHRLRRVAAGANQGPQRGA